MISLFAYDIIDLTVISQAISYAWWHDIIMHRYCIVYDIIGKSMTSYLLKESSMSYDMKSQYHAQCHIWNHTTIHDIIECSSTPTSVLRHDVRRNEYFPSPHSLFGAGEKEYKKINLQNDYIWTQPAQVHSSTLPTSELRNSYWPSSARSK